MTREATDTSKIGLDDYLVAMGGAAFTELKSNCCTPYPVNFDANGDPIDLTLTQVGEWILSQANFMFAASTLWVFDRGVYRNYGRLKALKLAHQCLVNNESWSPGRQEGAVRFVETAVMGPDQPNLPESALTHINVINGRVNIVTGELAPHSSTYIEICQFPVKFDADANCPRIDRFLAEVLGDDDTIDLVLEMAGYCLLPVAKFEQAFVLTGSGANGKSTFLNVLETLLGRENVSKVGLQALTEQRFSGAELLGKVANICADIDSRALSSTGVFKAIVSGDAISAERKFKDPFEFRPFSKLIFSANALPYSGDHTAAYFRRWSIIPFNKTFPPGTADTALVDKLTTSTEMSGLLNKALRGLRRLLRNGKFTQPASTRAALDEYRQDLNPIHRFIQDRCLLVREMREDKQAMYNAYKLWCEMEGIEHPINAGRLGKELGQLVPGFREIRPKEGKQAQPRVWRGIALKDGGGL